MSEFSYDFKRAAENIGEWRYDEMKMFAEEVLRLAVKDHANEGEPDWTAAARWLLDAAASMRDIIGDCEAQEE